MQINGDTISFESTRRKERANSGIINIVNRILYSKYNNKLLDPQKLTTEEQNELVNFMMEQWESFRLDPDDEQVFTVELDVAAVFSIDVVSTSAKKASDKALAILSKKAAVHDILSLQVYDERMEPCDLPCRGVS